MRLKKLLLIIGMAFVLLCAFPAADLVFAEETERDTAIESETSGDDDVFDWSEWFKEKAMPVLVATGAGIVAVCSFLYPVLHSVNGGVRLFKKSKTDFDNVTQRVVETQTEITEFKDTSLAKLDIISDSLKNEVSAMSERNKEELLEIKAQTVEKLQGYENAVSELAIQLKNVVEIVKIGFGNDIELVKNGYAKEIMKVGVEDEEEYTQVETTNSVADNI